MSIFLTPVILLALYSIKIYNDRERQIKNTLPKNIADDIINKNYVLKHCKTIDKKKQFYHDEEKINAILHQKLEHIYNITHDEHF